MLLFFCIVRTLCFGSNKFLMTGEIVTKKHITSEVHLKAFSRAHNRLFLSSSELSD